MSHDMIDVYNRVVKLHGVAMTLYYNYRFRESHDIFNKICGKVLNYPINNFICLLYFSYHVNICELGYKNEYRSKMDDIIDYINSDNINSDNIENQELIKYCNNIYALLLLKEKNYLNKYIKYISSGNNVDYNITRDTMSFLTRRDKNKTQLVYLTGGIGDKIMYSRFIDRAISFLEGNKLLLIVNMNLYWIYRYIYSNIPNVEVKYYNKNIPLFDAHCAIHMLNYYLNIGFNDIYENRFLMRLPLYNSPYNSHLSKTKKNIIINWKGSRSNIREQFNRSMPLKTLIPLFELDGINWISIQKDVLDEERELMKKYNISNLEDIDSNGSAFSDSISLFNRVDLIITTDTSIVHVAGNMGKHVKCYLLLIVGCDWRWDNPRWYPDISIFKQKTPLKWDSVVDDIKRTL